MFHVGQQFEIYTLIQQLGCGGFGEVWLAERRTKFVTTQVAVKLPLAGQVDHAAIKQEAQVWAQASGHANILPIIEANEYNGQILIVSEYAVDGSLEGLLQRNGGALPVKQAVEMTIGILKGLEFLHSRKIIHRDIKPANILLQGDTPRLADFGISRMLKTTSMATSVVGTPYYMAPEAFERKRNAQTDVWSVGVILYQMLKGELPFSGDNITDLFGAIMLSKPEPLPNSIPVNLEKIVWKALSKDTAGRYQTAREMRDEIDECWRRLYLSAAAQTPKPSTVKKVDNQTTIIIPASPSSTGKKRDEIKKPIIMLGNRSMSLPASPEIKAKTKRLYLAILAVAFLLVAIIAVGYLLRNETSLNTINETSGTTASSNNTNTSPVTTSSSSVAINTLLIPFRKGDKFGFSDVNKKLVIEATYDKAEPFSEGLAAVKLHNKWGVIDKIGHVIIPPRYDYAGSFSDGLFLVTLNGKRGVIDNTGKEIIPPKYEEVSSFNDGVALVKLNRKCGFIDKTGHIVAPPKYDEASSIIEGLAWVRLNGKVGVIDKTGKEIIPPKYQQAFPFSEGLMSVWLNGKAGFVDETGKEVIPLKYDYAIFFSEGLGNVKLNGKWGFIDKTGKEIIPPRYDYVESFGEGLANVKLNDKYGFVDKTGKEIIPPKYDQAGSFSDGLASVALNDKYGFVGKTGKEVVPLKYDFTSLFREGLAQVKLHNKWGYIDKIGNEVVSLKYDETGLFEDGLALVTLNGKQFYIDKNGTEYYEP